MQRAEGNIQVVTQALSALEVLADADRWFGVTEVATELGLSKPSAHRILRTLTSAGYAKHDTTNGTYSLGVRALLLGSMTSSRLDLRTIASPLLTKLRDATQETIHFSIYSRGDVVYVDKLESPQPVAAKSYIGGRAPAYCLSTGQALLAFQESREIERVLSGPLEAVTPKTITDPDKLRTRLGEVRKRGYAVNRCGWRAGVCGVAAPIKDHRGMVVASVGVCAPETRFTSLRVKRLTREVLATATLISEQLGYSSPPVADRSPTSDDTPG